MGHVLLAAPPVTRFALHQRLAKALLARGHRATVLAGDPVSYEFHARQGLAVLPWRARGVETTLLPLEDFAATDLTLWGRSTTRGDAFAARVRTLGRLASGLREVFERERPECVFLHQERGGIHRLVHFLAREHGVPVLHTGTGLLPHTMQWDESGLDGDSSLCRRIAYDYRDHARDEVFLAAALAAWTAGIQPFALPQDPASPVPAARGLVALAEAWRQGLGREALHSWSAAREWLPQTAPAAPAPVQPPDGAYVVLLAQDPRDPRLLLDAPQAPAQTTLLRGVRGAASALDPACRVVVLGAPATELPESEGVLFLPLDAAPALLATALAAVTVNHPLGIGALLMGTPLLHLGRSAYGIRGVATQTALVGLEADLRAALHVDPGTLRERFLTRVLQNDHVWCSARLPDHNGVRGLVERIEMLLRVPGPYARGRHYRPGPAWPLAVSP